MSDSDNEVRDEVLAVLHAYKNEEFGLTEREIISQLPQFLLGDIREAIQELVDDDYLFVDKDREPTTYNLIDRIDGMTFKDDVDQAVAEHTDLWLEDEKLRADNSRRILRNIAEKSVMRTVAESYTSEENLAFAVRSIASQIANENPVDLILEMVEWVVNDINQLADILAFEIATQPAEVRKVTREISFRTAKAKRLFQGLFRLDDEIILTIPSIRQMQRKGRRVKFDPVVARERLESRVHGAKFINIIQVPDNKHNCAVGTDASIGDVLISHARGSFIPPIPASLFISGAAMRVRRDSHGENSEQYWDYDIDPRELEEYAELRAAEEGLFISPNLKGEVITDYEHLSIAAMELRQYLEELRVIDNRANWHPFGEVPHLSIPPKTSLLFRDGRLFPLVHRIEDYEGASAPDDVLYGTIVRKEIEAFRNVFHKTAGLGRIGATYAGAVKAPAFSWLSMIVFWYLYRETKQEVFKSKFYRPPLNDQAVSHLLFWGVCENQRDLVDSTQRYALTTFQTTRRFSDIAFPSHPIMYRVDNEQLYVNEDSESDWFDYIEYHMAEVDRNHREHRRSIGSLGSVNEYSTFIDLCRRASVVMFYGAPCRLYQATIEHGAHSMLPRWEVSIDASQNGDERDILNRIVDVLMWICDVEGLDQDGKHAVGGFNEISPSLPLLIPDVVAAAHDAVVFSGTEQKRLVEESIYELIHLLRMDNQNQ